MTGVLAWLGVILLAWVTACAAIGLLYLLVQRGSKKRARQQARDDAAADAVAQFTARIDEEYRALCEKEGGRG